MVWGVSGLLWLWLLRNKYLALQWINWIKTVQSLFLLEAKREEYGQVLYDHICRAGIEMSHLKLHDGKLWHDITKIQPEEFLTKCAMILTKIWILNKIFDYAKKTRSQTSIFQKCFSPGRSLTLWINKFFLIVKGRKEENKFHCDFRDSFSSFSCR